MLGDRTGTGAWVGGNGLLEQRVVARLLHGLQHEGGIGGGVLRAEDGKLVEVTGIGDDGGVLAKLFEAVHGRGSALPQCAAWL